MVMEKENTKDGFEIYKWKIGPSEFAANIACGARLMKWNLSLAGGKSRKILYWDDSAPNGGFGESFAQLAGGNPILFPFAGMSFANSKAGFWKNPDGEVLPMRLHGYACSGKFEPVSVSDSGFRARFLPDDDAKKAYPYDYDFYVEYAFEPLLLSCKLELVNKSKCRIPWGAGMHFYFNLPWHDGYSRSNYRIAHDAKLANIWNLQGECEAAPLTANSFDNPQMCNRALSKLKSSTVKFGLKNGEEDISIIVGDGAKPPAGTTILTWTQSDEAPYYCVEPWMSPPKSSSKPIKFVDAGCSGEFFVKVSLQ